jgi:hypothetical protein
MIKILNEQSLFPNRYLEVPCFCGYQLTTFGHVDFVKSLNPPYEHIDVYCHKCNSKSILVRWGWSPMHYVLFNLTDIDTDDWTEHVIKAPELLRYTPPEYMSLEIELMVKMG